MEGFFHGQLSQRFSGESRDWAHQIIGVPSYGVHRGVLWVAGLFRCVGAVPMPFRRTFAPVILTFTHSTETSLRHPGSVRFPTPLNWHGQRPLPIKFSEEPVMVSVGYRPTFCESAVVTDR